MITGWGINSQYKHPEYFRPSDGRPLCATKGKKKSKATLALPPNWPPDHPNNCIKCQKILKKIAVETTIGKTSGCEQ